MSSNKSLLENVRAMMKHTKEYEKAAGYDFLVGQWRLPKVIKLRKGLRVYTYRLQYGDVDGNVWISYTDRRFTHYKWRRDNMVLMHYEESSLQGCITKAWRRLAQEGIKVPR